MPSKYVAISSVGQLQAETIGLPGLPGLWIFGSMKKTTCEDFPR